MRCIRILPDTWARTLWPLSISTRNIALGNGSTTLPSTSIASSLLMAFSPSPFMGVLGGRSVWMRAEMTAGAPNSMALATWTRRHEQEGADTHESITHSAPGLVVSPGLRTPVPVSLRRLHRGRSGPPRQEGSQEPQQQEKGAHAVDGSDAGEVSQLPEGSGTQTPRPKEKP